MQPNFRFWSSAFYLAIFAAGGSFGPFLNAHYRNSGIPVDQIGILAALPMLMTMFATPAWSFAADAFNIRSRLLPFAMLIAMPAAWLLTRAEGFWSIAVIVVIYAFCIAPVLSLGDAAVLSGLGEQRYDYGKMRVWGAVGYGLSAWAGGALMEWGGLSTSIYIYLVMMGLGAFAAAQITKKSAPSAPAGQGASLRSGLRILSTDLRWYGFLGCILMAGLGYAALNSFFILRMKDLGGGEGLFGFATAVAAVSELPIFFFSAAIMKRWSARGLLVLSLAVLALRLLLISLIGDPRLLILLQLFHGLSFSAIWAAGVNYANEIAPPALKTSAQALFGTTLFGVSGALGSFAGGRIYHDMGGAVLFQIAAGAVLAGWIIFEAANWKVGRPVIKFAK
jgi:MFS transporter, PPP family, 3-phenylpropionic acid transporter